MNVINNFYLTCQDFTIDKFPIDYTVYCLVISPKM